MTTETTFAVSGQHYLFNVQTFAHTVLALGGDAYAYALRDRTTPGRHRRRCQREERAWACCSRPRPRPTR